MIYTSADLLINLNYSRYGSFDLSSHWLKFYYNVKLYCFFFCNFRYQIVSLNFHSINNLLFKNYIFTRENILISDLIVNMNHIILIRNANTCTYIYFFETTSLIRRVLLDNSELSCNLYSYVSYVHSFVVFNNILMNSSGHYKNV